MENLLEILAIILSIVALIITVIGFFASLKFYRDGVKLQENANNALTRIEEKASSIQTQVGGMFDKTLEAALKGSNLSSSFEEIKIRIEEAANDIVEGAVTQIGNEGETQRERIKQIVDEQMKEVSMIVDITRESVVQIFEEPSIYKGKILHPILFFLLFANDWVQYEKLKDNTHMHAPSFDELIRIFEKKRMIESQYQEGKKYFRLFTSFKKFLDEYPGNSLAPYLHSD